MHAFIQQRILDKVQSVFSRRTTILGERLRAASLFLQINKMIRILNSQWCDGVPHDTQCRLGPSPYLIGWKSKESKLRNNSRSDRCFARSPYITHLSEVELPSDATEIGPRTLEGCCRGTRAERHVPFRGGSNFKIWAPQLGASSDFWPSTRAHNWSFCARARRNPAIDDQQPITPPTDLLTQATILRTIGQSHGFNLYPALIEAGFPNFPANNWQSSRCQCSDNSTGIRIPTGLHHTDHWRPTFSQGLPTIRSFPAPFQRIAGESTAARS